MAERLLLLEAAGTGIDTLNHREPLIIDPVCFTALTAHVRLDGIQLTS
jgi:hypothetical protein